MRKLIYFVLFFCFLSLHARAFELTPELKSTGLKTVVVTTIGEEEPVCESVEAPEGSWGVGTTNVNKVPGSVTVFNPDGSVAYESGEYMKKESGMTIKVRGNTSARYAKKPFKIKLEKKGDLMGRGDKNLNDKNWVLLTARHNLYELGFLIGKWIEMPWSPAYEYVNVVINDDFRGVYLLAEAVERNEKCRIMTEETGFVAERDPYWWNENGEYLPSGWNPQFNWTMKYPDFEDLTEDQKDYISGELRNFEQVISSEDYEEAIDVDSFCKWVIAQDILGTSDGGGTNFYLARNDNAPGSKLYVPVLWDVDSGEETVDAWSNVHYEKHIAPLFNNANPFFKKRYVELYREFSPVIYHNIEELTSSLRSDEWEGYNEAALLNNEKWGDAAPQYASNQNADDMDWWFPDRSKWLDKAVEELAESLDKGASGVGTFPVKDEGLINVYTISGIKIYAGEKGAFTPSSPGIYMIHSATGVKKVILRY